jgi:hypothetical protein
MPWIRPNRARIEPSTLGQGDKPPGPDVYVPGHAGTPKSTRGGPAMNRGIIGVIIGVLVIIILVIVILQLT